MLLALCNVAKAEDFVSGGITRNMIVYAPKNLPKDRPLLISLHGMNQDAAYQSNQANYQAVADTAKFVVVYPDGINKGWDLGGMKDINFILDIIDEMVKRHSIDRNRVYLSGFSMGGMMTYYAMTKIADKIAAFAPVSGYNMGGPNATSSRPIPILHVHGTGDDVCTYSPVMSHVTAWAQRNKCNMTPETITPYPKGSSTSNATMYRYKNGLDGVEVAHIAMPGKGHWHSNDPVVVMTNKEIWNFCSRWSLTPGPKLVKASPEDNSFDMTTANRKYVFTFDKAVDCSNVRGGLLFGGKVVTSGKLEESGESKTLTFNIPATYTFKEGEYQFKIVNVASTDGGNTGTLLFTYTYGVKEVGDEPDIQPVLTQDWASQQSKIGEGCPLGWERVNTRSGATDKQTSGAANTGGARMKYFQEGGDFTAGFYLSARDYDRVDLTYGSTSGYPLKLSAGRYRLSLRSTYWNSGAQSSSNTFDAVILKASDNSTVATMAGLKPVGCLNESSEQKVSKSELHTLDFSVPADGNYLLRFTMTAGWNGIILGEPTITTAPSLADEYKGTFLRTMKAAKALYKKLSDAQVTGYDSQMAALSKAIETYESFVSIEPSAYTAATTAVKTAMKPLENVKVTVMGDADGDGILTMKDAEMVVGEYLGTAPEGMDKKAADVDGNGIVNVNDANAIVNKILQ